MEANLNQTLTLWFRPSRIFFCYFWLACHPHPIKMMPSTPYSFPLEVKPPSSCRNIQKSVSIVLASSYRQMWYLHLPHSLSLRLHSNNTRLRWPFSPMATGPTSSVRRTEDARSTAAVVQYFQRLRYYSREKKQKTKNIKQNQGSTFRSRKSTSLTKCKASCFQIKMTEGYLKTAANANCIRTWTL